MRQTDTTKASEKAAAAGERHWDGEKDVSKTEPDRHTGRQIDGE